jgi:hypothetical protein
MAQQHISILTQMMTLRSLLLGLVVEQQMVVPRATFSSSACRPGRIPSSRAELCLLVLGRRIVGLVIASH